MLRNLPATFSTMVGGVISDIYHAEDRNTPMALFSGSALFGTGLAPLLAGAVVTHTSWRWIYYSHAMVSAVFVVIIFFFFKETRGSVLLSRKAKALNAYYEQLEKAGHHGVFMSSDDSSEKIVKRIRWKVKSDEQRDSLATMIQISVYRPFREFFRFLKSCIKMLMLIYYQTCLSQSLSFSFSLSGFLSVGPHCIFNSVPSLWSSARTMDLTLSRLELCSPVSNKNLKFQVPFKFARRDLH